MKFTHERAAAPNSVRWYAPGEVRAGAGTFTASVILPAAGAPRHWPVGDAGGLTEADLAPLFELAPELVLLGTGERQVFPAPRLLAAFAARGIGCEVMDNRAACRTFNLLLQEDRNVVLALILVAAPDRAGGGSAAPP